MTRLSPAFALLALLAAPVSAARKPDIIACSAAAVTAGLCETGDSLLVIPLKGPQGTVDAVSLEYALAYNYQATVRCEQAQKMDGRVLVIAGVTQGDCSSGQIGTVITNPQTPRTFAAAVAQRELVERVVRYRRQLAEAAVVPSTVNPSE